jgi:uncharacterized repeat protein (TIGR03833 family)
MPELFSPDTANKGVTDKRYIRERYRKMENKRDGRQRRNISPGDAVRIVLKNDQRTGKLTDGVVKDILTNSPSHPHGIKVRLSDGQVGRVQEFGAGE